MTNTFSHRSWAEIDLDGIAHNFHSVRSLVSHKTKICCVVKANAYGHGAAEVARRLEREGADLFAVSTLREAVELREADIKRDILILGYTDPEFADVIAKNNMVQCVYSEEYAHALAESARKLDVKLRVHIKIDVGMGRIGFVFTHGASESVEELLRVCRIERFIIEGIFTHFPGYCGEEADNDSRFSQYARFNDVIEGLKREGIEFKIKHCANSATLFSHPQFAMDMVRVGIALYGDNPAKEVPQDFSLRPTFTLKSVISHVKEVCRGDRIGYGGAYIAEDNIKVATVPIGYGDGFRRSYAENSSSISVHGTLCKVIGRVCMDQLMIDVTNVEKLSIGEEVIIFGEGSPISLSDFAEKNNTISYEILTAVTPRVERIYV